MTSPRLWERELDTVVRWSSMINPNLLGLSVLNPSERLRHPPARVTSRLPRRLTINKYRDATVTNAGPFFYRLKPE
jgi:hypothetical protein